MVYGECLGLNCCSYHCLGGVVEGDVDLQVVEFEEWFCGNFSAYISWMNSGF